MLLGQLGVVEDLARPHLGGTSQVTDRLAAASDRVPIRVVDIRRTGIDRAHRVLVCRDVEKAYLCSLSFRAPAPHLYPDASLITMQEQRGHP